MPVTIIPSAPRSNSNVQCKKCSKMGHFTQDCPDPTPRKLNKCSKDKKDYHDRLPEISTGRHDSNSSINQTHRDQAGKEWNQDTAHTQGPESASLPGALNSVDFPLQPGALTADRFPAPHAHAGPSNSHAGPSRSQAGPSNAPTSFSDWKSSLVAPIKIHKQHVDASALESLDTFSPEQLPRGCQPLLCNTCPSARRTMSVVTPFSTETYPHLRSVQAFGEEPAGYPLTYLQCPLDVPKRNCPRCGGYHPKVHQWEIIVAVESVHENSGTNSEQNRSRFNSDLAGNRNDNMSADTTAPDLKSSSSGGGVALDGQQYGSAQDLDQIFSSSSSGGGVSLNGQQYDNVQELGQTFSSSSSGGGVALSGHEYGSAQSSGGQHGAGHNHDQTPEVLNTNNPNLTSSPPPATQTTASQDKNPSTSSSPTEPTTKISSSSNGRFADLSISPPPSIRPHSSSINALLADSLPDTDIPLPSSLSSSKLPPSATNHGLGPGTTPGGPSTTRAQFFQLSKAIIHTTDFGQRFAYNLDGSLQSPPLISPAPVDTGVRTSVSVYFARNSSLNTAFELAPNSFSAEATQLQAVIFAIDAISDGVRLALGAKQAKEKKKEREAAERVRKYVPEPIGTGRRSAGKGYVDGIETADGKGKGKGNEKQKKKKKVHSITSVPVDTSMLYVTSVVLKTTSSCVYYGVTRRVPEWKRNGWKWADGEAVSNVQLWQEVDRGVEWLASKGIRVRMWLVQKGENRCAREAAYRALHGDF